MFEKKKIINCYTVDECTNCNNSSQRKFKLGDYLFKQVSACKSCDGKVIVTKIFGETMGQ